MLINPLGLNQLIKGFLFVIPSIGNEVETDFQNNLELDLRSKIKLINKIEQSDNVLLIEVKSKFVKKSCRISNRN